MTIRTLRDESLATIHGAFVDAFSQYEVKMDLSLGQLAEMLVTRSHSPELSVGAYEGDRLVAFTLVGARHHQGRRLAYDVATGVVPGAQGQGMAGRLLDEVVARLALRGYQSLTLEVLENNVPARAVYLKAGFQIHRRLQCFQRDCSGASEAPSLPPVDLSGVDEALFCSFAPSWQNTLASWAQNPGAHGVVTVADRRGGLGGYAIVHRANATVLQVGAAPGEDRRGVVEALLDRVSLQVAGPRLRYLNVEAGSWMAGVLADLGFENFVTQDELRYTIPGAPAP